MGDGRGRLLRGVGLAGVLAWCVVSLVGIPAGCGGSSTPPGDQGGSTKGTGAAGTCGPGKEGCACTTPGQTVDCGKVVTNAGNYVTCSMGTSTCANGTWGACQGATLITRSTGALMLGPTHIESISSPCGSDNVCDPNPNCTQVTGTPTTDVDAANVYETDAGVTLVPPDSGPLSTCVAGSLECDVVACGGDGGLTTTITGTVTDPRATTPSTA